MSKNSKKTTALIVAGTRVTRSGVPTTQKVTRIVTVRKAVPAKNGKTRIYWHSNGTCSALVK